VSPAGGVGLDLLEVERLERTLARRPGLEARLFTEGERAYAASRPRPAMHLAARFCAKEAVAKALGLRVWSWQDIEVVHADGPPGPPAVALHGALAGRQEAVRISLTHTRGLAGAVAVIDG